MSRCDRMCARAAERCGGARTHTPKWRPFVAEDPAPEPEVTAGAQTPAPRPRQAPPILRKGS